MHYYKHHIGDYLADTTHLTLVEHGAYLRLMMLYYQSECALNANALRMICARSAEEKEAAESVLNEFFDSTENGWVHKRCDDEISRFHGKSDAAKASADARWGKRNANEMRTHTEGNANQEPLTNNQEPVKEKKRAPRFDAQAHLAELGVDASISADWLLHRKTKKAAVTPTVIDGIQSEASKARITLSDALAMCCQRGWTGFKAEWVAAANVVQMPRMTQHQLNQAGIANSIFGYLDKPALGERMIAGEVVA